MKKVIAEISWTLTLFLVGFLGFGFFIRDVLPWTFHDDGAALFYKLLLAAPVGFICLIGLPVLALVLSNRGVLPGTRR